MADYIIGVDIGATKSHLALFDSQGKLLDFGLWGPLNYELMPGLYTQFEEEFGQFVSGLLNKNKITIKQIKYSVLGVGGVDTKKQHGNISEILKRFGFENFTLVNDAFLGISAGSKTGYGICAINGSGCTLAGINSAGQMLQIGGVGSVSADMGGGGYMGQQLLSAVYTELFRKGEATIMTKLLFEKLGLTSKYDYVETIHEKTVNGSFQIQSCAPMVFEAVIQNDPVAAGILQTMAANYAGGISCMIEELRFPIEKELDLVLAGSVFVKGKHPMLIDSLKDRLSKNDPQRRMNYVLLDVPNVAGAVLWALNELDSGGADKDMILAQLRPLI